MKSTIAEILENQRKDCDPNDFFLGWMGEKEAVLAFARFWESWGHYLELACQKCKQDALSEKNLDSASYKMYNAAVDNLKYVFEGCSIEVKNKIEEKKSVDKD